MAELILSDMVVDLISKLGSLVLKEIGLWWGLKDELQNLKETLSTIEVVLLDAEEKSMVDHQVKHWLGMLSDAMYDADDLLDDFSTEALRQQVMDGSDQFAFGSKVKAMKERLDKISATRMFHLEVRYMKKVSVATGWRQTHSSPPQVVIGREADKEAILKSLLSSDYPENVSVVPIVGTGGLGKTTLAQLVYNDAILQKHFELKMWVCLSQNFDVQLLVKKVIESATGQPPQNIEMDPLIKLLHKEINWKKYLIVLDDVWTENANEWLKLKDLLTGGAKGSKILLTTRLRNVAKMSKPIYIHELRGLSEDEAWSLFKQMTSEMGQVPNSSYEAIGKEIVAKCCGVPLAIRAIGGMMYSKDLEEWLLFKDEELSKIDAYKTDIFPILELSYNHLPSNYKNCFAYCSLYPEDHKIDVEELIQLWKAQGYLKSTDSNKCLQDVGLQCFTTLLRLSFFQDEVKDDFGNIVRCKMHDLMHNLAVSVAGDNFSTSNSGITSINERTKHITFRVDRNSPSQVISSSLKAKRIRTILSSSGGGVLTQEELDGMFCNLRCLRVLNLYCFNFDTVPSSIYKLKGVNIKLKRHLDLSGSQNIKKLPDSITNLWNLQVLKLKGCRRLKQLPDNIAKLINLTELHNDGCKPLTHMPIKQLTRLEKLSLFVIAKDSSFSKHSGGLDELHSLNKLRGSLEIEYLEWVKDPGVDCEAANLKGKQLQILRLNWNSKYYDRSENDEKGLEALRPNQSLKTLEIKGYRGERPPSWLPLLTNLVSVSFWGCKSIEWLPPLDELPYLKTLYLFHLPKVERIEVVGNYENRVSSSSFFPSLTHLWLQSCPNLKGFMRGKSDDVGMKPSSSSSSSSMEDLPCFPCLSELIIVQCPNLTCMPLFPELKRLEISGDSEIISVMKVLKRETTSASESTSSHFSTLSQLEHLKIEHLEDCAVNELLPYLPSLQRLLSQLEHLKIEHLEDCAVDELLPYLPSLQRLQSQDKKDDGMHWQSLKVLRSVSFWDMQNLVSLPKGLQYVTTLQRLSVDSCGSLASIPEWMGNLISLQHLSINYCPQLSERCKNNTAEDWPNISHIPNIQVDNKYIQRNGGYLL